MLADITSKLTITEADGGITFPLDTGSMLLGSGGGGCPIGGGIHLASTANLTAIVGPAHTDGTQESLYANGLCIWGSNTGGAVVTKGLLYANHIYTNTSFIGDNVGVCPNACFWIENIGGTLNIGNVWGNVTSGVYSVDGSAIVLYADEGQGCGNSAINIWGSNFEHANGSGNSEMKIIGDGSGGQNCSVYVHDTYVEKNVEGTPSTVAIAVQDCVSCSFTNMLGAGGSGTPSGDMINVSASAPGRTQNVMFNNVSNIFQSWTNTINDTTTGGSVIPVSTYPLVSSYISNPGFQQPPVLPPSTIQSLGSDVMNGLGSFATGDANFGTDFAGTGCLSSQGLTCTYTRTNSTAPPSSTYSQEVQITTNTDTSSGYNGLQYGPTVSFTAGQTYQATFWGKGDGSFGGFPTFLLWNSETPVTYCEGTTSTPFTTTWTLYSFLCTPTTSGSAYITIAARTPIGGTPGSTGTFWLGGFVFAPVQPLTPGQFVTSVGPYGIGTSVNGASISAGAGAPTSTCGTSPTGNGSLWLRTDGTASTTLYLCAAGTWNAVTVP
jgi:hypothetical protein